MDKPHVTMTLEQYDEMVDYARCLQDEINDLNQKIEMIKTMVIERAGEQIQCYGSLHSLVEDIWVFLDMGIVETHPALQDQFEWYEKYMKEHMEKEHANAGYQE